MIWVLFSIGIILVLFPAFALFAAWCMCRMASKEPPGPPEEIEHEPISD